MGKLSKAQWDLLHQLAIKPAPVSTHYRPAINLVKDGLAEWQERSFSDLLAITPAGRAALAAAEGGEP